MGTMRALTGERKRFLARSSPPFLRLSTSSPPLLTSSPPLLHTSSWAQLGNDLIAPQNFHKLGAACAISKDGSRYIVGSTWSDGTPNGAKNNGGHVEVSMRASCTRHSTFYTLHANVLPLTSCSLPACHVISLPRCTNGTAAPGRWWAARSRPQLATDRAIMQPSAGEELALPSEPPAPIAMLGTTKSTPSRAARGLKWRPRWRETLPMTRAPRAGRGSIILGSRSPQTARRSLASPHTVHALHCPLALCTYR